MQHESFLEKAVRATHQYLNGEIDSKTFNSDLIGEEMFGPENTRRCAKFLSQFLDRLAVDGADQDIGKDILYELKKERKKIQTANVEYNANQRAEARYEMFMERLEEVIREMEPISKVSPVIQNEGRNDSIGVLCIADAHNGTEINMKNARGDVVNVYSPEILQKRLENLKYQLLHDNSMKLPGELIIFDLGDSIQGYLRMSDLVKVKTGVLESTIQYAEMISQWLNDVQQESRTKITYCQLGGNHAELRLLGRDKNFEEENLGRVIREFVNLRLKDNPLIFVDEYKDFNYKNVLGVNILAMHGENSKDTLEEISYWENYNNLSIDVLVMGHFHHGEQKSVGIGKFGDKEIIKVPSLVGVDTFSRKCRRIASPGAKFFLVEDEKGKTWEKTFSLN